MKKRSMSSNSRSKIDRKTVEKNRRIHMKGLCFKLAALIPHHYLKSSDKDMLSQQDQLDHATSYIRHLRERVERLNDRKERATRSKTENNLTEDHNNMMIGIGSTSTIPTFELRELGSIIEVILISGVIRNFMLYEVVSILEQEGAEVVSASFTTVGDKVFQTIHAQVRIPRLGVEISRVNQRLQDLIY
ncbi:transcription factor bHLH162-like [Tripterygium wilfordii]|uniref:transcription factor bHLH162-like n=1 Tax=Tripterygium wilfordii TaxID=458696 RepID=UPI0018F801D9|nr:transcription factor bHLH162-like [Tripterygium wilfordii]